MIYQVLANTLLAVIWMFLMDRFTFPMFVTGFLVGAAAIAIYYGVFYYWVGKKPVLRKTSFRLRKLPAYVELFFVFSWELLKANIAVLKQVFKPKMTIKPGIVAMPIDLESDVQITLLANMITLTPGTITAEVSPDNKILYIHVLECEDAEGVIAGINNAFVKRIKGVW